MQEIPPLKHDKNKIKSILFDLGGVLLNIDYQLTEDAFKALGLDDFDQKYSQASQTGLFDEFETGKISTEDFLAQLEISFEKNVSKVEIKKAWNAMLLDFPSNRLMMLDSLKSNYNLLLLSNTNEIHFNAFNEIYNGFYEGSFSEYFNQTYYSHLIGLRKPDPEVFLYILEDQNLRAEETLFIDDSEQHIQSARKLGLQTIFLEKGIEVIEILRSVGILT